MTAQDIMEYDLDSTPVDPRGRTSVLERFIHGEVYKARPDVGAVIHTHSPTVVPFSVTRVPVWDIRDAGDPVGAGMLVRNAALGKSLAATLGDKPVALMRGHGNVIAASNVRTAVRYAIYTEVNARMQAIAISLGGPIAYISAEEGVAMARTAADTARAWDLWKKKALDR